MSEPEGKRLQPRMTRGSWRLSAWSSGLLVLCFSVLAIRGFTAVDRDIAALWIYSAAVLVNAVYFFYLLRVRRNDATFWDHEESQRAEWDRRGRKL